MAKSQHPSPAPGENGKEFLGGGVQFNAVGANGSSPTVNSLDEETAPVVPARRQNTLRSALIVLALAALACALYAVSNLGGVEHRAGHGGISPAAHSPVPPRNF